LIVAGPIHGDPWYNGMVESTAHLIRDHIASGARLMARQKEIIAELKERGVDVTEAERTLAQLSACIRVLEKQWLAIFKQGNDR
jgi:soluble P-type ATPase